ncbi:LLM class flavin-dependent oxidoreductase [Amorphoplanes digitatis]|uniref:Alkanesulfonate monooxygenase SsuD/methylene tetrahydromethanopterin reductase-like flavin-dependent oxidoreductase (Luciferase family) n=1 Tax=Actinoplanes digitatis TaxID=1868 RepID=A0A7W7HU63_9ACTN|nr:LLM class flavin-dependent oxidoreductase [Actinoplanes digitatis]MBB4760788.1 alkanesulfonate monooxygenase SsuD/methylene tetrahydromethanopterin reductase-like flavin-dependent oxidoreductase (luciferase family) [Actinoplanes digitatis]GID94189.1 luciferase-like protein [Actinoplanes digitatis]
MNYGVILPGGTAPEQLQQAVLAEQSGWDGVFVWESASGVDAWSLLAAIAAATTRIRLGTMLTPLPWRRPWKVASQVATVDQLSAGRAVLGIGVGALDAGLPQTGEVTDLRERAAMMDEGIDLIRTLWAGGTSHHGPHYDYQVEGGDQAGRPVQQRIPIWVVAVWPRPKSLRRVLKCDGVIPNNADTPDEIRKLRAWLIERGAPETVDILAEGETPGHDPAAAWAQVSPWVEAGCTWWMETRWQMPHDSAARMHEIRERIAAGPPRVPA